MPATRETKEALIEEYGAKMARAQVLIWAHYRNIPAGQITNLRRQLQAAGSEAMVVKNTLMRRALQAADRPVNEAMMTGPCLVAFVYGDIPAATKAVIDFARVSGDLFQIAGGVMGHSLASEEQVRSLVNMPSREQLIAQVLGGLQAPISGLLGTLSAVMRGIMTVLSERAKQLEGAD